ncbi:dockerin type I domain-containing protein [Planctomycetes bacterium TBK1r]|uniref:Dockerin type I repeat protein n=1 Tax=Stieleria magnilauensis TaxID=2527963 RepID=A0ABX5Y013_9BACT|nr:Dockerin type I repeat protein [Planctomycetes bacterium TBK1r]
MSPQSIVSKNKTHGSPSRTARRRLGIESLEPRRPLAGPGSFSITGPISVDTTNTIVDWTDAEGAVSYDLTVGGNEDGSGRFVTKTGLTDSEYEVGGLSNGTFAVIVTAYDAEGNATIAENSPFRFNAYFAIRPQVMFVTSGGITPTKDVFYPPPPSAFEGPEDADWHCTQHAVQGGLVYDPYSDWDGLEIHYKAFLSSDTERAVARIGGLRSQIINTRGELVALSESDLYETLDNPILYNEFGEAITFGFRAWTGTTSLGDIGSTAENWTSYRSYGTIGDPRATDGRWLASNAIPSNELARLYCIGDGYPNLPVVADAGGPYTVIQGDDVVLNATGSETPDYVESVKWDLTNDGDFDDLHGETFTLRWQHMQLLGLTSPGTYPIALLIDNGHNSYTASTVLTVVERSNTPPIADAGGPYVATEGSLVSLDASGSSDADQLTESLLFQWDLDYDGSNFDVDAIGLSPTDTFTDDFATRVIALRVSDSQGLSDLTTTTLAVDNLAPGVSLAGPSTAVQGQQLVLTLSASDPSSVDQAGEFTYAIDWDGDGVDDESTTGLSTTEVEHVFDLHGIYTIAVTATDKDGAVGAKANHAVEVTGNAPTVVESLVLGELDQRSAVDQLTIQFDQIVQFDASPSDVVQIVHLVSGQVVDAAFDIRQANDATNIDVTFLPGARVDSRGVLVDGNYQLTIDSSLVAAGGAPLDGDGAGGPYQFAFHRLAGDANGDRQVTSEDMSIVIAAQGSTPSSGNWDPNADVDGDGRVSVRDRFMVLRGLGNELLTVAQGGGVVNRFDTSNNGEVSPLDALRVINRLASLSGEGESVLDTTPDPYDVNRDGKTSPLDALHIINHLAYVQSLNSSSAFAEGENADIDVAIGQVDLLSDERDGTITDETLEVLASGRLQGLF